MAVNLAALVVVVFDVVVTWHVARVGVPADLAVYRLGAGAVLDGAPLYRVAEPVTHLGFTYPVFAAALFAPLALLPPVVAFALVNGQVNLLLAVLVLVDVTVLRGCRGHGVATGLAAGIKITPALFILVLASTRQWRAGAMAVVTFAATVAVGVVLAPGPSWWYWSGGLLRIGRIGVKSALGNLSLVGLVARALGLPQVSAALAGTLAVLTTAACLPLLHRLHCRNLHLTSAAACGVLAVLITPISWSHHWIWLPLLALCAWRSGSSHAWFAAVAVVLAVDARWLTTTLGSHDWPHTWLAGALANSFPLMAAVLLLAGTIDCASPGFPPPETHLGQLTPCRSRGRKTGGTLTFGALVSWGSDLSRGRDRYVDGEAYGSRHPTPFTQGGIDESD